MEEQSLDEAEDQTGTAEESPDQSINSPMSADSGICEGDEQDFIKLYLLSVV